MVQFGEPINLGPQVNTEFRESFLFIGDNNILYFSSDGRIGLGGFDIYYTDLDKKGFPVHSTNIGEPVNSKLDDFGLYIKKVKIWVISLLIERDYGEVNLMRYIK